MGLRDRVGRVEARAATAACAACGRPVFEPRAAATPDDGPDPLTILIAALTPDEQRAIIPPLVRAMRRVHLADTDPAARGLAGTVRKLMLIGLTGRQLYELFPEGMSDGLA